MESLSYLSGIAVILILGILASIMARKLKTSNVIFLVLMGIIIGNSSLRDLEIFQFSSTFMISLAILTLAIIVFDGSSRFNIRELDTLSAKGLEVVVIFVLFNMVLITTALNLFYYGFTAEGVLFGLILAIILAGTDPATTFILLGENPHRVLQFLKVEALINTPVTVLFPFLLLDLLVRTTSLFTTFLDFVKPFLQQIVVGLGVGMLIGLIVFKLMRDWYSENLSPIAVISSTLLAYILAENLGGNGVLAVAVLGLLFGNTYVKQKGTLQEYSSITAYSLQILVFVLIGMIVTLPTEWFFWAASLTIFLVVLLSRFLTLKFSLKEYDLRELIFMTLNMPKGIALAVVALSLAVINLQQMSSFEPVLNLMIIILVYSLIVSTITTKFSKFFLKLEIGTK